MSGRVATDIAFSNALLVASLWIVKEWFLTQNVGVFWVLMRILACCALGRVLREVATGGVPKALVAASSAKVRARLTFFSPRATVVTFMVITRQSGLRWRWPLWPIFYSKVAFSWHCRSCRPPGTSHISRSRRVWSHFF